MSSQSELQKFLDDRVIIIVGDISQQRVDAIVNAANSTLMGGGGVDGAIHRSGGSQILEACKEVRRTRFPGGLPTGEAVITTAGKLAARYVIHTVGPIMGMAGGAEADLLAACYRNCLELAVENDVRTIAFPSISTGAFGYPREEAAGISSEAIETFLSTDRLLIEVRLVFYSIGDANVFLRNHRFNVAS